MKHLINYILLFFICICIFIVSYKFFDPFVDSDPFWHVAVGSEMLKQHTIIKTAIFSFPSEILPYVSHEASFQLLFAFVHNLFGWNGIYVIYSISLFFLALGSIKLISLAKEELGDKNNYYLHYIFVIFYIIYFHLIVFSFKPLFISFTLTVWFVIFLKSFLKKATKRTVFLLSFFSFLIANFHGGTWIVSFAFFTMAIIHLIYNKQYKFIHLITTVIVPLAGLLNPNGYKNLLYVLEVNDFKSTLLSFQPINFSHPINFIILVLFLFCAKRFWNINLFHKLFILGLLYLSVSSPYQRFYLFLFFPYFLSAITVKKQKNYSLSLNKQNTLFLIGICLLINVVYSHFHPIKVNKHNFPETEMKFILHDFHKKHPTERPNVLTEYNTAGYVSYGGGDVLSDPRFDPYLKKESIGLNGWNAYQRQYYAYKYGFLLDVIKFDKPDYVIIPYEKKEEKSSLNGLSPKTLYYKQYKKELGEPIFKGKQGAVFKITN